MGKGKMKEGVGKGEKRKWSKAEEAGQKQYEPKQPARHRIRKFCSMNHYLSFFLHPVPLFLYAYGTHSMVKVRERSCLQLNER